MYFRKVVVENKTGLHARPASVFTQMAAGFSSEITVEKGEETADAKSPLYLMALGVFKGTEIVIKAEGPDEKEAVSRLVELVKSKFGEED